MGKMKKPPCPVCNTRSYRKDDSGFYVCKFGHQLTGYVEERGDEEALMGSNARRQRSRSRKRISRGRSRKYDYDAAPFSVICEVFQSSLRLQTQSLIKSRGLPQELELAVLDLWSCYLTALEVDLDDRQRRESNWSLSSQQGSAGPSSGEESATDWSDTDPEDIAVRRRKRRRSRSRTPGLYPDPDPENPTATRDSKRGRTKEPGGRFLSVMVNIHPYYSLVLLHLGCVLLRLPIWLRDVHRWAGSGEIPYYTAADQLPLELTSKFSLFASGLERKTPPQMSKLHIVSTTFRTLFTNRFSISFPPPNLPLLWIRTLTDLSLPPTFYADMSTIHSLVFPGANDWGRGGERSGGGGGKAKSQVALALVVFKLRCGAENERSEMRGWVEGLVRGREGVQEYAAWTSSDVREKTTEELITYVDRFANRLGTHQDTRPKGYETFETALNALLASLPSPPPSHPPTTPTPAPTPNHIPYPPIPTQPPRYIMYNASDTSGPFHHPYDTVVRAAADLVGVGVRELEREVNRLERRLGVEMGWVAGWVETAQGGATHGTPGAGVAMAVNEDRGRGGKLDGSEDEDDREDYM
ncbi:uncharacterized protein EV422DRAFT_606286 [Fimicolochytrium jonesii]|uniref:uncharacterized protein n=1 Tax=Fimicolochytrium jonesii TaxID=1396493 RepID=UPI0022FE0C5A|nr:uncharacterized protein EV422DRAFT_606286 [Fimicolochytrium jonesii]KAI8817130.1 hypothetical protein EV422DRAFT_606286 [Fimicolochytrium jonesii]